MASENIKENKAAATRKRLVKFAKEIKLELKKVSWPNRAQLVNNTLTVIASCIIVGIVIWVVDVGLKYLYDYLFTNP